MNLSLSGKNIIIGVTGSIAAYKVAVIIRLLKKNGANVKVIMTPLAKEFISPLTLATLSKNPILVDFFNPENGDWNSHVDLGLWADLFLIAPATANTLAKMSGGIADNLLLTTYLSAKCPIMFSPAMDLDMYKHFITQQNINNLIQRGNICIEPASGELASGLEGKGRMQEPEIIVEEIKKIFHKKQKLSGKKILITAGPTIEEIDPVRYISNYSSGKMGYALAEKSAELGADVCLISGPVNIELKNKQIKKISVKSANELYNACLKEYKNQDIIIFAAAVADYTPKNPLKNKLKKDNNTQILNLELIKTIDIASEISLKTTNKQFCVGFALETENETENAKLKLTKKNLDMIVLNSINDKNATFGYDTNKINIIDKNNNIYKYELKRKEEVAVDILNKIITLFINNYELK